MDGYTLQPTGDANLPSHALVQFRDYFDKATFVPGEEIIKSETAQLARMARSEMEPTGDGAFVGAGPRACS